MSSGRPLYGATSISQFGITWTFDQDYPSGQFANGDYWVVGPMRIVEISPRSEATEERTINGSMVNPRVGKMQGYDSATYAAYGPAYDPALNVALGVSPATPLTLPAGSSLISSISEPVPGNRPQLKVAAILTVLAAPAPAGSFRPPYCGPDKSLPWNTSQLDYSKLRTLAKPPLLRDLDEIRGYFLRPWLEHNTDWTGDFVHPSENQPHYGRDMAQQVGEALLSLQMDYPVEEKETIVIRLVQYGIDVYGAARAGGAWLANGGNNQGRKMPLLVAATLLGDADMLVYGDAAKHFIFQEDQQTWYVTEADVGRPVYAGTDYVLEPYIEADVGMPEWGIRHALDPYLDGRNWDAPYRLVSCPSLVGHALVARLMGLRSAWNWPAFFDYYDRFWAREKTTKVGGLSQISVLSHEMWSMYRDAAAPVIVTDPQDQTVRAGDTATLSVAATGTEPLFYQWKKDGVPIAGATASTLTLSSVTATQAGTYAVTVANGMGTATSATGRILIAVPPVIVAQPANQTIAAGGAASFSVVAAGDEPLSYQWKKDGVVIDGATGSALTLAAVTTAQAGAYSVTVANGSGQVTSGIGHLVVIVPPAIVAEPVDQTITAGSAVSFNVTATGSEPLSYQWKKDGVPIAGATGSTLTFPGVTTAQAGSYLVDVSNAAGSVTSNVGRLVVTEPPPPVMAPVIVAGPEDQTVRAGDTATLSVVAAGTDPLVYQWKKDGVPIDGKTESELTISAARVDDSGEYGVDVSNPVGSTSSDTGRLVVSVPSTSRLVNTSVRSTTRGDASPLIMGFVIEGIGRPVLIRAIGPSLAPFGVADYLPNPRMDVYATIQDANQIVATNDNWGQSGMETLRTAMVSARAFPLDAASLDSALITHVAGARTVHAIDTAARSGVTLLEVYDLGTDPENRIINMSARNFVGTGEQVLIAGFVVSGDTAKRLLVRGIGPSLAKFGVRQVLTDPRIDLHTLVWNGSDSVDTIVAGNDDWAEAGVTALQTAFEITRAFPLIDVSSKDAAFIVEVQAGVYTVLLSGKNGETGEGMIEVYEMP